MKVMMEFQMRVARENLPDTRSLYLDCTNIQSGDRDDREHKHPRTDLHKYLSQTRQTEDCSLIATVPGR